MDSKDGLSAAVETISQPGEFMSKSRSPMLGIFFCFLLSRYAIFSAILVLKVLEIIRISRSKDSPTIRDNFFDSLRRFISPDLVVIPTVLWLSSLSTLMLIYTVEINLKEPEITMKSLMIRIWKKLRDMETLPKVFVRFLSRGYLSFSLPLTLAALLFRSLSLGFYFLASIVTLSSVVLVVYFDFFFFRMVLVSVVETGCKRLTATAVSEAEIEEGQKISFKRITIRLMILSSFIGVFYTSPLSMFVNGYMGIIVNMFIASVNISLVEAFGSEVHSLFYLRWTSEPVEELVMEERGVYNTVSSTSASTEDIPLV